MFQAAARRILPFKKMRKMIMANVVNRETRELITYYSHPKVINKNKKFIVQQLENLDTEEGAKQIE